MNQFESYLVELLQGKLSYEGRDVPLLRTFSEEHDLPVVTLDVLPPTTTRVGREVGDGLDNVMYYREATIDINLWCNTEEERESLNEQILTLFYDEQADYLGGETSMTDKYGLVWGSTNIDPPRYLDELERHPPLLRSMFRCETTYVERYEVEDTVISEINMDVESELENEY